MKTAAANDEGDAKQACWGDVAESVRAPCLLRPRVPGYVDDFLAAGLREILHPLLTRLLDVWKESNPDFLGRQPGDVDTMRFLGLDIELDPEEGTWLVHQQSYIYAFLQETFDPECLKDRILPGEPESFSYKPHVEAHAQQDI